MEASDKPEFLYDEKTLREIPKNPSHLRAYIAKLDESLSGITDNAVRVSILGEMGTHLRSLGEMEQAEQKLEEALSLVFTHKLGVRKEIQQKIRLAHVLQWKGQFERSNVLFDEILSTCESDAEAEFYLPFALQHAGKNFFDQERYDEALALFERALTLRRQNGAPADQVESSEKALAETQRRLLAD